jgi:hypothetical protein
MLSSDGSPVRFVRAEILEALLELTATLIEDIGAELVEISGEIDAPVATLGVRQGHLVELASARRDRLRAVIDNRASARMERSTARLRRSREILAAVQEIMARQLEIQAAFEELNLRLDNRVPATTGARTGRSGAAAGPPPGTQPGGRGAGI